MFFVLKNIEDYTLFRKLEIMKRISKSMIYPSNRKTLFLRNLETILLNHNVLNDKEVKNFRGSICYEIKYLLESLLIDEREDSNQCLRSSYISDSLTLRREIDEKKISKVN